MTNTVAIIGGGFSGTMAAVNLARFSNDPLNLVVINAHRPFGRGTAYGTTRSEHLLNVAARNMSAFPDHPSHFLEWLRSRSEYRQTPEKTLREMFVPRMVYGDYIRSLAETFLHPVHARFHTQCRIIEDEAVDIVRDETGTAEILLGNGDSLTADTVLLATGNQPPAPLPSSEALTYDQRYCCDPWSPDFLDRLPPHGSKIVILGTGLTMVDVIVSLDAVGWQGHVIAVSRNGMLPQSHFRGIAYPDYLSADLENLSLDQVKLRIEEQCRKLTSMSQNPAIAVDKLRPHTQKLWASFSVEERQRFLRDHAARWNVIRHRIAGSIHDILTDRIDDGSLKIIAGPVTSLTPTGQAIEVRYADNDADEQTIAGQFVVNCTGPQARFSETQRPLFRNLLNRGDLKPDSLDMGIEIGNDYMVLDQQGQPVGNFFAIGPLLKGSLWETTAIPELRSQAMQVAQIMLNQNPSPQEAEDFIEYCI